MAYRFELVSPERRLASEEVDAVRIPGADGDMTAAEGHTAVVTSLRPGVLIVESGGSETRYAVTGGFAEVGADSTTVLAERALPAEEVDQGTFDDWVGEARASRDAAKERHDRGEDTEGLLDSAEKLVEDMVAMGGHIGLDPNQPNL
ncbi:F0F1 ATP synthase subunit epsilon [Jannaschia sp. Os4]|uniref:F0F1 ATP synthase subunit epsilon n=1 Tax=Jannaschia sp. Os4 TaxID=2807617 RepID=UPI001939D356|nr:F0F1 ATP synthase subunit epsilon [Jannaschia sp. Os4]MBM2576177.1 F0F1 ATP synthase subunit epsilon [Jannaschia sp. Os4]